MAEPVLMQKRTWYCISEHHYKAQLLTQVLFCHISRKQRSQGCNDNEVQYWGGSADYEVHNLVWQAAKMDWEGKSPEDIFPWYDNDTIERAQPVFTVGG